MLGRHQLQLRRVVLRNFGFGGYRPRPLVNLQ
jgi:hypothetical protein